MGANAFVQTKLTKKIPRLLAVIFLIIISFCGLAQERLLTSAAEQQEYMEFLKEFRCVTCPNQNIMDSSAPVAQAMKEEIARRWQQGEPPEEIRAFLLSQYGDYVLYRPVLKKDTLALWLGPFAMLFIGFFIWLKVFRSMRGSV